MTCLSIFKYLKVNLFSIDFEFIRWKIFIFIFRGLKSEREQNKWAIGSNSKSIKEWRTRRCCLSFALSATRFNATVYVFFQKLYTFNSTLSSAVDAFRSRNLPSFLFVVSFATDMWNKWKNAKSKATEIETTLNWLATEKKNQQRILRRKNYPTMYVRVWVKDLMEFGWLSTREDNFMGFQVLNLSKQNYSRMENVCACECAQVLAWHWQKLIETFSFCIQFFCCFCSCLFRYFSRLLFPPDCGMSAFALKFCQPYILCFCFSPARKNRFDSNEIYFSLR